ncbi:aerobic respiration two-component sensor histidine kinase ArcB [Vibrio rumoiensis]|uniref:Aerobic respiration control sensor protein n=1 Tax=Vibrio rumoiensis 1S-45 TaxID=1188252 RepID=A0A1E5DYD6_9VIBR|nr:aerobic respiration two-component sensor histidine kinase ArcB [Vibrio rumoiensis]OEF22616.1 aerobic respiration two-component sensor histidine kinase ArcB [Vibrio rumoiensis 1S-45]
MKLLKNLARYYVDLLVKLGMVRFSILLALALVCFSVLLQVVVSMVLRGEIENVVIIRSIFFGLLITPWAVYFLTVVVDQLEESRQRLSKMVFKLKDMRARDRELNVELQQNIRKLNQQIEEREKAEEGRQEAIQDLENEVYEREKTQVELAQRTALMRSFLDASPDLIYYRNTDGEFSGCNKAFEELVGLPEKKLVGLSINDVYSDAGTRQQVESTDAKVFADNKELTYEIWLQYPDNRKAYFEFRKLPFYSKDNQLLGLVGFGRDITERKVYQDALLKASQDKTTFISTISHELRTPLNGIVGLSRILLDSKLDEEQRQYMQTINVSAITLGHIFNDVIDLDKFDRSELELLAIDTDFKSFITDIESISGLMAEQKGLRFELDRLSELPQAIMVDATRLRQVIWNLINNAMKFTKEGGVTVNVSADFDDHYADIQFEIEDTGIGIPESEMDNIFGMYYQVKSGKDNLHAVGTGIGLAVSQELTHRMGGEITVLSELGFGSTFTVSIRVPVTQLSYESDLNFKSQPSLRIFMVEDIELNITVARSVLENLGHTVDVAMSGEEALKKFNPCHYDLVLLDIQLPDMTGFDIAQQLRQTYAQLPPLVALTANTLKDKHSYQQRGMDDAINKPLSVKAIYKVIEKCIKHSNDLALKPIVASKCNKEAIDLQYHDKPAQDKGFETSILDIDMLNSYIEIVGTQPVMDSVLMFEGLMPDYIQLLNGYMASGDDENLVSEAHKIKGAASSVGLQRIQQLAQKAQSPEDPSWRVLVRDWVEAINQNYQPDINTLKQWLETR